MQDKHNNVVASSNAKIGNATAAKSESSNEATFKNSNQNVELNNDEKNNGRVSLTTKKSSNSNSPIELALNSSHNNLSDESSIRDNSAQANILNSSLQKNTLPVELKNENVYTKKLAGIVYANRQNSLQNFEKLPIAINDPVFTGTVQANFTNGETAAKNTENKNASSELSGKSKNIKKASLSDKALEVAKTKTQRKRDEKITWVYFADAVVSNVSFSGKFLKEVSSANFTPVLLRVNQKENKVIHNSALGFEAGAQMNYAVAKRLNFTTGAHLTYSGYNIISNQVHPTRSTLVLRDPSTGMTYENSYLTHYGDGTGLAITTLRNYSWQASIPLGLQYAFYEKNKLQFSVEANIEPSFVFSSNSFILSSDGNNYVNDPSLLRKWNFNSNFGTFVTFSSPKFHWQIGPNVRYQWLSTYQKNYTVKEHLIDYGIRIGISKIK